MDDSYRNEIAKLEALYASNPGGRVFVHLAEALRRAGEQERARGILEEGLARHPDSASGFVVLGRVLTNLGDGSGAEAAFNRVLELDGGNLVALRGLGDLALEAGHVEEAARHYRELAIRSPYNEEVQALLARAELGAPGEDRADPGDAAADGFADGGVDPAGREWMADAGFEEAADTGPGGPEHPAVADTSGEPAQTSGHREDDAATEFYPQASEQRPGDEASEGSSATPGDTGATAAPDTEYGIVDIDALPGDLATFAGLADEATTDDAGDAPAPQALEDLQWDEPEQPEIAALWEEAQSASTTPSEDTADLDTGDVSPSLNIELPSGDMADMPGATDVSGMEDAGAGYSDEHDSTRDEPVEFAALSSDDPDAFGTPSSDDMRLPYDDTAAGDEFEDPAEAPSLAEPADAADVYADATSTGWDGMPDITADADAPERDSEPEPVGGRNADEPAENGDTDDGAGAGDDGPSMAGDQLETETMADLYRSQGLLDRAAGVYRSLLRRRPADEALAAKLQETEAALAAAAATDDEGGEGWLRGTGTAWTETPEPGESESPYAWMEAGDESAASAEPTVGPTIGEYLKNLVSWQRPAPSPADDRSGVASETQSAPSDNASTPLVDAPDFLSEEPWLQGVGGAREPASTEPPPEDDVPRPEPPPPDPWAAPDPWGGDAEPWSHTPAATTEESPPRAPGEASPPTGQAQPPGQPGDPVEDAFNEWFSGPAGADTDAGSAVSNSGDPAHSQAPAPAEPTDEPDAGAASAGDARTGPPSAEDGEEDEDLAMFRSWLQSLKK
ncbi:MAG TPA: tetratricopeptide repeat protein [Longimicrobiales bacterium]|nr:tetratricopeptide repeat protein [Longimicrobiales bacterium]